MRPPMGGHRRGRAVLRRLVRLAEHAFAVLGVVLTVYLLGFDLSRMVSGSMSPALRSSGPNDGDWVLSEKLSYLLRVPHRWELVEFRNAEGLQVMKRVVGLPGEEVSLDGQRILVDGEPAERPPSLAGLRYYAFGNLSARRPVDCGEGYYVLGDDSVDSEDSRYEGPLQPDRITGRPWLIVWPPGRIGFANP
jgi:signal peptidase I